MNSKFRIEPKQPKVTTAKLRREHTAALMRTERKTKRDNIFNQQRLASPVEKSEASRPVKDVRARQLEAWKKAREEADNSKRKRKPFVVGTVRHNIGSPYQKRSPLKADIQLLTNSSKKQNLPVAQASVKQIVASGRVTRAMARVTKLNEAVAVQKREDIPKLAPKNFKFKAPKGIAPLPLTSNTKRTLQVMLSPFAVNMVKTGEHQGSNFTPSGVAERSAKKGSTKLTSPVKKKLKSPLLSKKKLDYVSPEQNKESILVEAVPCSPKTDVSLYRKELNSVIEQLENLCNKWSLTKEQSASLPIEVNDAVDVATGQTKLLIKEKLAQYRGLIDECEKSSGPVRVMKSDLQGFWEMVNLQVQNVISKFERLDVLKANNWIESKKQQTSPLKKKKKGVTKLSKPKKVAAKSSVRDHIAALRRAKASIQSNEPKTPHVAISVSVESASRPGITQPIQTGNSTPVVVLIRTQLSEKQKQVRRCSTALMKITNQLKEFCTPETARKANTTAGNSSRRVSNRMRHLTPDVLNSGKKSEIDAALKTPARRKSSRRFDSRETPGYMFSTKVIVKDCQDMLRISQSPIEDKRKNKNSEHNALKSVNVSPVSAKNKENLFHDNEEPCITPPNKTYSKSPMKSVKLVDEESQFELLKKTPTFAHSSPASGKPKMMSSKDTPRARRQQCSTSSVF